MAPPRTFKTALLADVILRYPGPVVATTTKDDVFALTSGVRARRGPVHVFNPQQIGGVPSTFRWSPVAGCEDPATAIRRADAFAHAVSHKGVEDGTFWSAKASDYLRAYFHAAALAGADLRTVAAWVAGADPATAEDILAAAGARPVGADAGRAARRGAEDRRHDPDGDVPGAGVHGRPGAGRSRCCPAPGEGFDIGPVPRGRGHAVPDRRRGDTRTAPVAPLFAAMAARDPLHRGPGRPGHRRAGGWTRRC